VSQLTAKQLQAVSALSQGLPISQIAKSLNISPRTVQRWMLLPQFATALDQVQGEVSRRIKAESVENATTSASRLENLVVKSLDTLEEILDNREARGSDRLQASKIILIEWQRVQPQPPVMHELQAVETLVKSGFLSYDHLEKLQQAVERLTLESQAIFQNPSAATSSLNSETFN
jgi:hypothetical protein